MLRLAVSNLVQNKARLLISVGGLGLALTLVLFFEAVFAGATGRLTAYIDRSGADVWVSQQGVRTMHMSASSLPASIVDEVKAVPGVEQAEPILYASDTIQAKGNEYLSYVFGVSPDAAMGGPSNIVDGSAALGPGEAIIDRAIARQAGLSVGDQVVILGRPMTVAGLTSGTSSLASSVAIIRMDDFALARGENVISFVLVRVQAGEPVRQVVERIQQRVDGVTVQTRPEFAAQESKLVKDMSADIINIMNTAGFVTGLAVIALTVYIATIARRREYGVLKAIGVRSSRLYLIVMVQALISVALGLVAGLGLTLLLSVLIPRLNEVLVLSVAASSVLRVALISILLAAGAALLPARQLASLEPVAIIRRG